MTARPDRQCFKKSAERGGTPHQCLTRTSRLEANPTYVGVLQTSGEIIECDHLSASSNESNRVRRHHVLQQSSARFHELQALFGPFREAVITLGNLQHEPLSFRILQIGCDGSSFFGACAPVVRVIDETSRHLELEECGVMICSSPNLSPQGTR
jgi:hypothetical protein